MWSYYGAKTKIAGLYPPPIYDTIIEPFAGSAKYALKYWERGVLLVDKSEKVIGIWRYLQNCSVSDIMSLPALPAYTRIDREYFDCIEQFWLMSFLIVQAAYGGNNVVSKWGAERFENNRKNIIRDLHKIKHWQFMQGDYTIIPNRPATWFIDTPYQYGGHKYPHSNRKLNFPEVSEWARSREGQTIVCENTKADWMPFIPLKKNWGVCHTTTEAFWTNLPTSYNSIQTDLFKRA